MRSKQVRSARADETHWSMIQMTGATNAAAVAAEVASVPILNPRFRVFQFCVELPFMNFGTPSNEGDDG